MRENALPGIPRGWKLPSRPRAGGSRARPHGSVAGASPRSSGANFEKQLTIGLVGSQRRGSQGGVRCFGREALSRAGRQSPLQRLGTKPTSGAQIRIHPHADTSDPGIHAYSCLRAPRFAIRRLAVRAGL